MLDVLSPPVKKLLEGEVARSNCRFPVIEGSSASGAGPAPAVVNVRPPTPEPAPPDPADVPPGPPPVDKVAFDPLKVPSTRPAGAPSGATPVRERRISVSAMSRS